MSHSTSTPVRVDDGRVHDHRRRCQASECDGPRPKQRGVEEPCDGVDDEDRRMEHHRCCEDDEADEVDPQRGLTLRGRRPHSGEGQIGPDRGDADQSNPPRSICGRQIADLGQQGRSSEGRIRQPYEDGVNGPFPRGWIREIGRAGRRHFDPNANSEWIGAHGRCRWISHGRGPEPIAVTPTGTCGPPEAQRPRPISPSRQASMRSEQPRTMSPPWPGPPHQEV